MSPDILCYVGPTGVGKEYVMQSIHSELSPRVWILPKLTTREPRSGEITWNQFLTENPDLHAQAISTISGVDQSTFQALEQDPVNGIVFAHNPFGTAGHRYGYLAEHLSPRSGMLNLVEPNIEFTLIPFLNEYRDRAMAVGLVPAGRDKSSIVGATRTLIRQRIESANGTYPKDGQRFVRAVEELWDEGGFDFVRQSQWAQDIRDYLVLNLAAGGRDIPANIEERIATGIKHILMIYQLHEHGVIDQIVELNWANRAELKPHMIALAGSLLKQRNTVLP